jgi:hypothetical protein
MLFTFTASDPEGSASGTVLVKVPPHPTQVCRRQHETVPAQGRLLAAPALDHVSTRPMQELTHLDRLRAEEGLFGYTVRGHPLERYTHLLISAWVPGRRGHAFSGDPGNDSRRIECRTAISCGVAGLQQALGRGSPQQPISALFLQD